MNKCGTNSPLWLAGPHPKRRHGIVTRRVCGHWQKKCCAFRSTPIQVKKCLGNYYVYKLAPPTSCYLAYCAGTDLRLHRFVLTRFDESVNGTLETCAAWKPKT